MDEIIKLEVDSKVESIPSTTGPSKFSSNATSPTSSANNSPKKPASIEVSKITAVVPKAERRGFLGDLTFIAEYENPKHYPKSTKWLITFTVAAGAAIVTTGENIFYPSLQDTSRDLHASLSLTDLSLSLSKVSIAVCPLWWSAYSEHSGRRTVYLVSFLLFVLWSVLSAISNSIGMLIAMRVLAASAASAVQSVGAGTVADVWDVSERGTAMGIFYLGSLAIGTLLGPLLGGVLTQTWGWRATQWFLTIYGGVVLVLITFCLPETSPPSMVCTVGLEDTSSEKALPPTPSAPKSHTKSLIKILIEPFRVVTYLRFAAISTTIYIASITFGTLGLLSISIQDTFSKHPYNLSTIVVGCLYIPIGTGNILGSVFGGRWSDRIMHREARKAGRYEDELLVLRPEDRVRENAWGAVVVYSVLLVWYGWIVQKDIYWVVPLLSGFLTGISSMILFGLVTTMLTELMPAKPASGVALNSMGRNVFACIGFAIAQPLIDVMGNGWLFTAAGGVMLVSGLAAVWGLQTRGARWREDMAGRIN